jgi:hypothetical protein
MIPASGCRLKDSVTACSRSSAARHGGPRSPRRPYDLRLLPLDVAQRRVPPTQVAEWAGHSVDVLRRIDAKCQVGQDELAKQRIAEALRDADDTPDTDHGHESADPGGEKTTTDLAAQSPQPAAYGRARPNSQRAHKAPPAVASWQVRELFAGSTEGGGWGSNPRPADMRSPARRSGCATCTDSTESCRRWR